MSTIRVGSQIATTTVVNTTTEADLINLTLPAGALAVAGSAARLTAAGDLLNNTGSAQTFTFRLKLGTTTVLTSLAISLGADADRRQWRAVVDILSVGTDSQRVTGHLEISDAEADTWTDHSADGQVLTGYGTAARDDAGAIDVAITVTLGAANASLEATGKAAGLEALR